MNITTTHPRLRTLRLGAVAAVAILGFAACGGDDDSAESTDAPAATDGADTTAAVPSTDAPATTAGASDAPVEDPYGAPTASEAPASTAGADAPAGASSLAAADSELGTILVDGDGMTLYMFVPDAQGASTCEDECLAAWPSFAGPATAGDGVDESLVATAARADDGSEQVTYDGWPLYSFAQDAAPGDVTGQGVGDVWYVVGPDGTPIDGA